MKNARWKLSRGCRNRPKTHEWKLQYGSISNTSIGALNKLLFVCPQSEQGSRGMILIHSKFSGFLGLWGHKNPCSADLPLSKRSAKRVAPGFMHIDRYQYWLQHRLLLVPTLSAASEHGDHRCHRRHRNIRQYQINPSNNHHISSNIPHQHYGHDVVQWAGWCRMLGAVSWARLL